MDERTVIISGAHSLAPKVVATIGEQAIVVAVDGGLDHALAAGLTPSELIGDLDSVTPDGLAWAEQHTAITRHPTDKDRTDTELALVAAAGRNPCRITLIGGGDRLDHTVAAVGALGAVELAAVPHLDAWWDDQHLTVVHGPKRIELHLEPGSTLSLLALHGPCSGVSVSGVRWELDDARLEPVSGRGISNEVTATGGGRVVIEVTAGVLTVFDRPHATGQLPQDQISATDVSDGHSPTTRPPAKDPSP